MSGTLFLCGFLQTRLTLRPALLFLAVARRWIRRRGESGGSQVADVEAPSRVQREAEEAWEEEAFFEW